MNFKANHSRGRSLYSAIESFREFDQIDMNENLQKGLKKFGIYSPSKFMRRRLLDLLSKKDYALEVDEDEEEESIFTYLIYCLYMVHIHSLNPQFLIVTPSKRKAKYIYETAVGLSAKMGAKIYLCLNRNRIADDRENLLNGAQIIIGTPDRIDYVMKQR